jgi:hypothetical protein
VAEIVYHQPDVSGWTGRTSLTSGLGDLRSEAAQAENDPTRRQGAVFASWWLDKLADAGVPSAPQAIAPTRHPTDDGYEHADREFPGWQPVRPPAPYWTPPLPLLFVLPATQNRCPIGALAPWWDVLTLPEHRASAPVASAPAGKWVDLGSWIPHERGGSWGNDVPRDLGAGVGAGIDVMATCVDVWSRRELTVARIAGPGLVGSLVPGYAEAKQLASTASEQNFATVVGCRIHFAFVSAVTFTMRFNTQAPLLSRRIKEVVRQRGYGESTRFTVGIEFSDGWRPYRAVLVGDHVPMERDAEPLQFAIWLARRVAHDRLQGSFQLGEADRGALQHVIGGQGDLGLRETSSSSTYKRTLRVELPGHRPVSVEFPGT